MDDFWGGFDFPTLEPDTPAPQVDNVIEATPSMDSIDPILVKRAMVVFFVIDISGSMKGARIGAVNDAIRNLLPELKKREASNTNAEIKVAILEFSSNANWRTITPQPVKHFTYDDITFVGGATNFGKAFSALNEKLSRKAFLNAAAGAYTPLIILLTDGKPSDIAMYPEELNKLKHNSWYQYATKAGIAIEEGAMSPECKRVLLEFTGNETMVLEAKNTHILTKQIELVTLTGVDFVTQQGSLQNAGSNMQPSSASNFGSAVSGAPTNINQNPNQNPTVSQNTAAQNQAQPAQSTPAPQPAVDVTAGANPVIPGLETIDWENDFPTF